MLYAPSFFALFHQEIAFPGKPKSDTLGTPPCTAIEKLRQKNENGGKMNMRNYTTQMDAARKGILTPEIKTIAQKEHMSTDEMMKLVAEGKVAICANKNHTCLNPEGVGSMLRTKINVNLGVSRDCKDYDIEMQKVMSAVNLGAEAIMDLSSHGNTQPFRQKLTH